MIRPGRDVICCKPWKSIDQEVGFPTERRVKGYHASPLQQAEEQPGWSGLLTWLGSCLKNLSSQTSGRERPGPVRGPRHPHFSSAYSTAATPLQPVPLGPAAGRPSALGWLSWKEPGLREPGRPAVRGMRVERAPGPGPVSTLCLRVY